MLGPAGSEIATIEIVGPEGPLSAGALDKLTVANDAAFGV
jgi:hypothetical protein